MSNVTLSQGIRQNLLSLQQTSALQQQTQYRLATGKKVNSAIDNPVNFFTAAGLSDRASQLNGLLDGMSNAVQTIQSASKGIDAITKLVQSAQSTIRQAQQDAAQNRALVIGATALGTATTKSAALGLSIEGAAPGGLAIGATSTVTIANANTTYTFKTDSTMTVADFVAEMNKSGIASAYVNDVGKLVIQASGSGSLAVSVGTAGADNTKIGLVANDAALATTTITGANKSSVIRANLVQQFNDLLDQIDKLSQDAGYNGTNLLGGDKLSILFNEKTGSSQNKLDVQGLLMSFANLGLQKATNGATAGFYNFQDDISLNTAYDALTSAVTSLRTTASSLGSSLSVVQTRQDFTKGMIQTLTTGADFLTVADQNEEGASLLALNTRQQLSQTALSLSAQAEQSVLRLFG
jgi:flagellin-like hook-associated protein FlgL